MSPWTRRTQRPSLRSIAGNRITEDLREKARSFWRVRSRRPPQEVRDQLKPQPLALFGMKLRPEKILPRDNRREGPAIRRDGDHVARIGRLERVGMHEIGVEPIRARRDAGENRVVAPWVERVPAHVRDLE